MKQSDSHNRLNVILDKATREEALEREEIVFLLGLRKKSRIDAVMEAAGELRSRHFGNRVFLYGFLYVSTYCRNRCSFCYYRRDNQRPVRYRRTVSDIMGAAQSLSESGVHLVDLTLGEDPLYFHHQGFEPFVELVKAVGETSGLPLMVSPGVVPPAVLSGLYRAGASWYACYQETHNRQLFKRLRPGQSYAARMQSKQVAGELGLLIEEGVLCGVGESAQDLADSIETMRMSKASQVRAMTFVPQKGTPMGLRPGPEPLQEMLAIAVLRLVFPDRLIPATLDVAGLKGLQSRLEAGANVVTSLVPPGFDLAGVAQTSLDIADARRTTAGILPVLEKIGMQAATSQDYAHWVASRRRQIRDDLTEEKAAC